jgi:predicted ATPase
MRVHDARTLAQELSHPFSLAFALCYGTWPYQFRREGHAVQEWAETVIALATEQGFSFELAMGTILRGWALAEQGQGEEGIAQVRQGLAAYRATGEELARPYFLALLAEAYGKIGQAEELYRLRGELTLPRSNVQSPESKVEKEAEECFLKAIEISREQQAKSLELRATMSLVRLLQQAMKSTSYAAHRETRARLDEAHSRLSEVYRWFTEGFDTKDLQEAKALLQELA